MKVRIDKSGNRSWYKHQIGAELFVADFSPVHYVLMESDNIEDYFIQKSDCTILQSDTQPEPKLIAKSEQTDELYLHIFENHGLRLKDSALLAIIEIANRSKVEPVKEEISEHDKMLD